jgi:ankyrin repeat protein
MTALDCAVENLELRVVEFLIANDAEVNAQNRNGWTALHRAIDVEVEVANRAYDDGDVDALPDASATSLLLALGADTKLQTNDGLTALDLALSRGHAAAVELLRKK